MAGSAEYGVLIQHTGDLKLAVRANLTSLGAQLLSAKVVTTDQYDEIRIAQRSSNDRAADLVRYVQDKVRQNCQHYYAFIGALKEDESEYRDILAKLEESLKRGAQPREGGDRQPIPTVPTRDADVPADVTFNSSMSDEDFFKWLKSRGISEKDRKALSENGVTPSGVLLLSAEDFDDMGLTKVGKKLFLKTFNEIKGQHEDTSERLTGQQPPHVNETLRIQQPSQAGGVATPTMQNQPASPIAASKFEMLPTINELVLFKYTERGERKKVEIISRASHKWKDIASLICSDANTTSKLEDKYRGDPNECLRQTFINYFIDKKPQGYTQDWNGVIELLDDVGLQTIAGDVRYAVKSGGQHQEVRATTGGAYQASSQQGFVGPSRGETRLGDHDHNSIYTKLAPHAASWRDIGRGLGFSQGEMNSIQSRPMLMMQAPGSYLGEILSQWLQWAPGDGRGSTGFATKESLHAALLSVNLGQLAQQFQ